MATGTVKWFSVQKSYGFITPDNGGGDVFVHMIEVEEANIALFAKGQRVSFDMIIDNGKNTATKLKLL